VNVFSSSVNYGSNVVHDAEEPTPEIISGVAFHVCS